MVNANADNSASILSFIAQLGAQDLNHVGGTHFDEHLQGVAGMMRKWGEPRYLQTAGLLHSIYGTEGFQANQLSLEHREQVRALIGEQSEFIVYVFCVLDRLSLDRNLDQPAGQRFVNARPDLGGHRIPLSDQQFTDLITLVLGDWLEQVEGAANVPNERFQWKAGDAWGYRRKAYRRMAELLGSKYVTAYDEVYAREPEHTKHICQEVTPAMQ